MPVITILFGTVLMVVGIGTYAASDDKPSALLLPIIFGLIALGLGVASMVKKDMRKHLMHGAVLLATLGVLVPVYQLIASLVEMWQAERDRSLTLLAVLLTVLFSGVYVYLAVQSFRAARRGGKIGTADKKQSTQEQAEPTIEP